MARIRSIKPDFWTDEKIVELSPFARLLFIGLWNFADDEGRMIYSPNKIKMQVFPSDNIEVSGLIGEIRGKRLVILYEVEGIQYLQIKNFGLHQKVDKRLQSKYPVPPINAELHRISPTDQGREGIKEGDQGREVTVANAPSVCINGLVNNSLTTKPNTVQGLDSPASSIASGLFQLWREVMNHPRAKLGDKSVKLVRDRLKEGFSEDDLRLAIVGCSRTPHNMGDNQQRTVYDDFDLIFRDSAHVRRFIKNSSLPPFDRNLIGLSPTERDNALSLQKMLGNEPIIQEKEVLEVTEEDDDEPY